jgi:hypothetical protein
MWLNGLALAAFLAFVVFAVMQSVFGWQVRNEELMQAGSAGDSYWHYLGTGHFGEAIFENWESEFLQMGGYVLLTAYLVGVRRSRSHWTAGIAKVTTQPTPPSARPPGLALAGLLQSCTAIACPWCCSASLSYP